MNAFRKLDYIYFLIAIISVEVSSLLYLRNCELCLSYLESTLSSGIDILLALIFIPLYLFFGKFIFFVVMLFQPRAFVSSFISIWGDAQSSLLVGFFLAVLLMFLARKYFHKINTYFYPKLIALTLYVLASPLFIHSFFMSMGV